MEENLIIEPDWSNYFCGNIFILQASVTFWVASQWKLSPSPGGSREGSVQMPRKDPWGGQSSEPGVCRAWQRSCCAAKGLGSPGMSDWSCFCQQCHPRMDGEMALGSHIFCQDVWNGALSSCTHHELCPAVCKIGIIGISRKSQEVENFLCINSWR